MQPLIEKLTHLHQNILGLEEKKIDKLQALIFLVFKKLLKNSSVQEITWDSIIIQEREKNESLVESGLKEIVVNLYTKKRFKVGVVMVVGLNFDLNFKREKFIVSVRREN